MTVFTKEHYDKVAAAINAAWRQEDVYDPHGGRVGISATARAIADMFKADNPRFDIFKFVEACTK